MADATRAPAYDATTGKRAVEVKIEVKEEPIEEDCYNATFEDWSGGAENMEDPETQVKQDKMDNKTEEPLTFGQFITENKRLQGATPTDAGRRAVEVNNELKLKECLIDASCKNDTFDNDVCGEEWDVETEAEVKPEKMDSETEELTLTLDQLIIENKRLQGTFDNLVNRQTILEEFMEMEHWDEFESYVQKRKRLVNVMGLDGSTENDTDGNRSSKSKELVSLLKAARDQAGFCMQGSSSSAGHPVGTSQNQPQQQKRPVTSSDKGGDMKKLKQFQGPDEVVERKLFEPPPPPPQPPLAIRFSPPSPFDKKQLRCVWCGRWYHTAHKFEEHWRACNGESRKGKKNAHRYFSR